MGNSNIREQWDELFEVHTWVGISSDPWYGVGEIVTGTSRGGSEIRVEDPETGATRWVSCYTILKLEEWEADWPASALLPEKPEP